MSANKNLQTLQNKLDDLSEITTLIREARDADVAELNEELDLYKDELEIAHHEYDKLKDKSKKQSLMYEELSYEMDEINRKWAEDNEQNKTMIEFLNEKVELLEKQLDRRD